MTNIAGELSTQKGNYADIIVKLSPGNPNSEVFDLTLPLDQVAEGCRAIDERRAIKTLLLA